MAGHCERRPRASASIVARGAPRRPAATARITRQRALDRPDGRSGPPTNAPKIDVCPRAARTTPDPQEPEAGIDRGPERRRRVRRAAILTTEAEIERWITALAPEALELQRPLPDDILRVVAQGERKDGLAA